MKKLATILSLAIGCAFVAPQAMAKPTERTHKAAAVKVDKKAVKATASRRIPSPRRHGKKA